MPETADVDTGVGQQGQRERPHKIHADGQRRRQEEKHRAGPGPAHQQGGEEETGVNAREKAADAAAGFFDAHGGVGQVDQVAPLARGHAQDVQRGEHVAGDPALEPGRQRQVRARRHGRRQQPQQDGDKSDPVERQQAQRGRRQRHQRGQQGGGEGGHQHERHQAVRPAEGDGEKAGRGEAGEGHSRQEHDHHQGPNSRGADAAPGCCDDPPTAAGERPGA